MSFVMLTSLGESTLLFFRQLDGKVASGFPVVGGWPLYLTSTVIVLFYFFMAAHIFTLAKRCQLETNDVLLNVSLSLLPPLCCVATSDPELICTNFSEPVLAPIFTLRAVEEASSQI